MKKIEIEQKSIEWHKYRVGKVTGTSLKSALGKPSVQNTLMYKMIADMTTEKIVEELHTEAIDKGNFMEKRARMAVEEELGLKFETTGMLMSELIEDFGISPDAYYEEDRKIVGGLEIKCPNSNTHVKYTLEGGVPKEYIDQVEAPFIASDDVQWWIFVSYDNDSYAKSLYMHTVTRKDIEDIDGKRAKVAAFIKTVKEKFNSIAF